MLLTIEKSHLKITYWTKTFILLPNGSEGKEVIQRSSRSNNSEVIGAWKPFRYSWSTFYEWITWFGMCFHCKKKFYFLLMLFCFFFLLVVVYFFEKVAKSLFHALNQILIWTAKIGQIFDNWHHVWYSNIQTRISNVCLPS